MMMNSNSRNDPMMSSFLSEDRSRFFVLPSVSASMASSRSRSYSPTPAFIISVDSFMGSEPTSALSDLAAAWSNEQRGVVSIKTEEDSTFLASPYAPSGDMDNGDIVMEEIEIGNSTTVADIKIEIDDTEFDNTRNNSLRMPECNGEYDAPFAESQLCGRYYKQEVNTFHMTEAAARRYVEEQFEKIAFVPSSKLSQREKIQFILAQSDCIEYSVDDVLNFDKRSPDSARACARIVQNIPQRYRWECVLPEDIPCCYTIVADCKKVSSRDKPPRPMNAFMIWAQGARRLINELCPKMQNALISEALGYYWRQKSDAFKKCFEQEKIKLRRFHNVEFPEYKYKPKTKVQKAKEKHELSLTKAKMRASVKREKLHSKEESNPSHRRPKCGRPRKSQSVACRKIMSIASPSHCEIFEELPNTLSTKPAIKDMLTLKILSDRRSKVTDSNMSSSTITVHSVCGQLSPIEVDNPYINDIFDDLGNFNMTLVNNTNMDQEMNNHVIPSSVYDTPANTPPVDNELELRLSPLHSQAASSSSLSSPKKVPSRESSLPKSNIFPINTSNDTRLKSHYSVKQIFKLTTADDNVEGSHKLSLADNFNNSITSSTNIPSSNLSTDRALEFSDLLFTYVTEALTSGSMKMKYLNSSNDVNGSANSILDMNNGSQSDNNNNNIDISRSYETSSRNSRTGNCFSESSDLDTLRLDLSSPFLSDDDMRSLLNSL